MFKKNQIHISVSYGEVEPQRRGERFFMRIASKLLRAPKDISFVQKVRPKLESIIVSGVSIASGRKMNGYFLSPQQIKMVRSTYDWPSKHHVTNTDLTSWRKLLNHIFRVDNYHLPSPLENWINMSLLKWIEQ